LQITKVAGASSSKKQKQGSKDAPTTIAKLFGQEKNITTYNLARMNISLHGMKDTQFGLVF